VRLFVDRARAVRPDLAHDDADLQAIARICRRLDGLPLAIELAAARTANMSLADLDDALEHRFAVLSRGRRTAEARHRSLRAVIDWSYRQLDDDGRTILDRLSIFAGRVDAQAIGTVLGRDDLGPAALDDALAQLVERSLLGYDHSDGRYVMLETIRAFGAERLEARGQTALLADRHATWVVELLTEAAGRIETAAEGEAVAVVVDHLAELRRAHRWLTETGDLDRLVRFVASSWWFINRLVPDLAGFAEDALAVIAGSRHPDMAGALGAAATAAWMRGDLEVARQRCLTAIEVGGTSPSTAAARSTLGDVLLFEGNLDAAVGAYRAAAEVALGDAARASFDRGNAALPMAYGGDVEGAMAEAGRALREADALGFPSGRAWARYILGEALLDADPQRSLDLHRQALGLAYESRNDFLAGVAGLSVASLEGRLGQGEQALQRYQGLIDTWVKGGSWIQLWTTMRSLVELLVRLGHHHRALVLMGAMGASYRAAPPFGPDAARLAEADETARAALGLTAAEAALVEGASLDDTAAVAYARGLLAELAGS
jgi:tetratricopeptide (TPR) repeat protein